MQREERKFIRFSNAAPSPHLLSLLHSCRLVADERLQLCLLELLQLH
jgi:hypothetical protein